MFDIKRLEGNKYLKPVFYKDSLPVDPLITFQPKSAPINPQSSNSQLLMPNSKASRNFSNRINPQAPNKKKNIVKVLPPLPNKPNFTSSVLSIPMQKASRFCLKSDSKPTRSKKSEVLENMNSSSLALSDFYLEHSNGDKGNCVGKELDEIFMIKTPTFSQEEEKTLDSEQDLKGWKGSFEFRGKEGSGKARYVDSTPGSASKLSLIGSSVSTEFPLLSPRSMQDQQFFMQYGGNNRPKVPNRDHPKIRVRKSGFPKDVFTLKY